MMPAAAALALDQGRFLETTLAPLPDEIRVRQNSVFRYRQVRNSTKYEKMLKRCRTTAVLGDVWNSRRTRSPLTDLKCCAVTPLLNRSIFRLPGWNWWSAEQV